MRFTLFHLCCILSFGAIAQSYEYEVLLEPISIPNLGGIHSYAIAQQNGEWLIVGGRLDGLHQRQPFAAFDVSGNNTQAIVVNPETDQVWKASYANLPSEVKEQLSSTNMQFLQEDDHLILTGGYGYSPTSNDHITYPRITVVDINSLISEIKGNSISTSSFSTMLDDKFAVTGGRLEKIDSQYYLIGGHRFDGRYNPMGPDHGPGFEQEYTNEIRPFTLAIDDMVIDITHHTAFHDEMHLHRRDYNLVPQIRNGEEELLIFSGVFQNSSDTPWLYPVQVNSDGYTAIEAFSQNFNHYHCATLPVYNQSSDEMHNIFFGGIAQFYMENGLLVQDNDVPFVNTIADVSRNADDKFNEQILPSEMPGYLGAGSEFIFNQDSPLFTNKILNGDEIDSEYRAVGYIFGGIRSTMPNIFFINDGNQSDASETVFKVSIKKKNTTNITKEIINQEKLLVYPNPSQEVVRVSIELNNLVDIDIQIINSAGQLVDSHTIPKSGLRIGKNYLTLEKSSVKYGAYIYKFDLGDRLITRKVIWSE